MKRVLLLFVVLSNVIRVFADPSYYDKHLIIVVDQAYGVQSHQNMQPLYNVLVDFLESGIKADGLTNNSLFPENFHFNPETDQISLFASSLRGSAKRRGKDEMTYDYKYLHGSRTKCKTREKAQDVVLQFVNKLIHPRATFQQSGKTLHQFLEDDLNPMMSDNDPLLYDLHHHMDSSYRNVSCSFSAYLYPLVLKRIDQDIKPAREYYILRISRFYNQNQDQKDSSILDGLLGGDNTICSNIFFEVKNNTQRPFYLFNGYSIQLQDNKSKTPQDNPCIKWDQLGLTCLQRTGLNVLSAPFFTQNGYRSEQFNMSKSSVRFDHNDQVIVDKIELVLTYKTNDTENTQTLVLASDANEAKSMFHKVESGNYYSFADVNVILTDQLKEDDNVTFKYVFYTRVEDEQHNPLLPCLFFLDGIYSLKASDFVENPDSFWHKVLSVILISLLILLVLCLYLRTKRGKSRKAWVDFMIRPVSSNRFMEVKDKRVVSEDCWYMGPSNQNQKISITGQLQLEQKAFCKKYKYRVESWISDADDEEDFTFRPEGNDDHGNPRKVEEWYKVDLDSDGRFRINVWTYLDLEHSPHLRDPEQLKAFFADSNHPHRKLRLQVKFRVLALEPKGNIESLKIPDPENPRSFAISVFEGNVETDTEVKSMEQIYPFIVKPAFERTTAWVAFDPGTSGSCAAFAFADHQPSDSRAVTLAKNTFTKTDSEERDESGIFPSIIKISDRARCFNQCEITVSNVETWLPGEDYSFGNAASIRLGHNRFQSIKKLLGYTNLQTIKSDRNSQEKFISGKDLAHLLVKGLYKQVGEYALTNSGVDPDLRKKMTDADGAFAPQRAIVAVPNNYTLSKIQEMVDSVKRLNCFKEVHYLYESEGVMMSYLHQMWSKIKQNENKLFIVYDMGGATINATAFKLSVEVEAKSLNPMKCVVRTIAKVGYCVGGDDVDYALIRILYGIPTIKRSFTDDEEVLKSMQNNKQKLIRFVTKLKLDLIEKAKGEVASPEKLEIIGTDENFINQICTLFGECDLDFDATQFANEDKAYLHDQLDSPYAAGKILYKYVYSKIIDAINELSADLMKSDVELIFSGRTSLFPYVQQAVIETLASKGFGNCVPWPGFNDSNGYLDADKVKTAVAEGACWYAIFNTMIRLEHDVITSTFGFVDQKGGEPKFVPIINRTERFDNNRKTNTVTPYGTTLNTVRFVQMLGSDYDTILADYNNPNGGNRHKMNLLDVVPGEIVNGTIESVQITIDDRNNFSYLVETSAGSGITQETNPYSRLAGHEGTSVLTEIKDENNESYIYAALSSANEIIEETEEPHTRPAGNVTRTNSRGKRKDLVEGMTGETEERDNDVLAQALSALASSKNVTKRKL